MPTVTLNRVEFEKLVGKKLPLETLKDRISMLGTDLEEVTTSEIIVEVFPNRPDMLSEQGFARAFSSFIGVKKGLRKYDIKKSGMKVIVDSSVTMRPYTACAIVKNLKFTDERIRELMQVQEKLAVTHGRNRKKSAYGVYPLEHIHFPIKYVAKDPKKIKFKPLGFDKEILASEVTELHPKGKAYKELTRDWKEYPFFIDAKNNVLCMLPFTNSEDTGKVEVSTKEVFVECTGTDSDNVSTALNMLTTVLADMGGQIYSVDVQYGSKVVTTPHLIPTKMKLDTSYYNKLLGLKLSDKEASEYLKRMGYGVEGKNVLVPAYRADILHQVDLAEDIAIAYGYENFNAEIPSVATIAEENPLDVFKQKIMSVLMGMGCLETSTYNIVNEITHNGKIPMNAKFVRIANAISAEYNVMRVHMLPSLLEVLGNNTHYEYPQRLAEIGTVFAHDPSQEMGVRESQSLAVVSAHSDASFTEGKQILDMVMKLLTIPYSIEPLEHEAFMKGRAGKIMMNNKQVGMIGEIHPQVLTEFKMEVPIVAFEVNVSELKSIKNV